MAATLAKKVPYRSIARLGTLTLSSWSLGWFLVLGELGESTLSLLVAFFCELHIASNAVTSRHSLRTHGGLIAVCR